MFGYVMADGKELTKEQKNRYSAVYCGICRSIRESAGNVARISLSYDMAFLAMLLMSLYEPQEQGGKHACLLHPMRSYVTNEFIHYAADMNILLGYYKCMDDYEDEKKLSAKTLAGVFAKSVEDLKTRYPRQTAAVEDCLGRLSRLEKENCPDPDAVAGCFGTLMGEILVYREDRMRWRTTPPIKRRIAIIPSWPAVTKTGKTGKTIWCWPWAAAPSITSICPWCRTRPFWTTSSTAAYGSS